MEDDPDNPPTAGEHTQLSPSAAPESLGPDEVRRIKLLVVDGPQKGLTWESDGDHCSIGSHPSNQLVLEDPTVSRFHCEIRVEPSRIRVRDLGSRNGTLLDGVSVSDAFVRNKSLLCLGHSALRFSFGGESNRIVVSERTEFGSLVGQSVAMRAAFALLERAATSDATVLIEGETGTGKDGAAEAIHAASARKDRPFVVVDCSALAENLLESELFGHEKGAFTGAVTKRIGAFEEASGGTVFLDEIGELPAGLQPKLLRVLEQREIRRVGSNIHFPIDVRVIAATNRDLRAEVNAQRFRSDVYFRLAVIRVALPSLRSRPEDIPMLVRRILEVLKADPAAATDLLAPSFIANLQRAAWPGNVREVRNYIEQCVVFREALPLPDEAPTAWVTGVTSALPFDTALARIRSEFEKQYASDLLRVHQNNVSAAARAAGISRVFLYRLINRYHLR